MKFEHSKQGLLKSVCSQTGVWEQVSVGRVWEQDDTGGVWEQARNDTHIMCLLINSDFSGICKNSRVFHVSSSGDQTYVKSYGVQN